MDSYIQRTGGYQKGGGWGGVGNTSEGDEEYSWLDEHWVMYRIVELLYCTPKTNITLDVSYTWILKSKYPWFVLSLRKHSISEYVR